MSNKGSGFMLFSGFDKKIGLIVPGCEVFSDILFFVAIQRTLIVKRC